MNLRDFFVVWVVVVTVLVGMALLVGAWLALAFTVFRWFVT